MTIAMRARGRLEGFGKKSLTTGLIVVLVGAF
jgi:hypothetical protein